ncbi:uncharacterized protein TNCV_2575211 [Trichonephila clavipes]|uniref:DUF4817 domain-containing protein n=1 Tax=Trichonephila clavipes TaxID=2585209 RepID=A0A8X6V0N4_TRICX|nr:uncharacterized protein TNCV_2575211 [Trichonephila clavipes]
MTHTSNERVTETVLFAGACARNFSKTKSAITVQRAFRIKFGCQPPNDNKTFLELWLFPQLEESELNNFIWQQEGAPPHWHLSMRDWLNITVPNQWISRKDKA